MSSHGVIDEFVRKEISITSDVRPSGYQDMMKSLFVDPCGDKPAPVPENASEAQLEEANRRNMFLKEMQRVKDDKKFSAFTPESEQALVAEVDEGHA